MSVAREGRALGGSAAPPRTAAVARLACLICLAGLGCDPGAEHTPAGAASGPRVVSLVPAASRILVALGAAELVAGRTADDRTEGLSDVPAVGRVLSPDPERVAALEPAWVLAWAGADLRPLRTAVEPGGGAVLPLRLERLGDVRRGVLLIADAIDRPARGDRLVAEIEDRLGRVRASVRGRERVRALWVVWADPPVVAGPGTLPADLLDLAGADNVFADARVPWPRPSREALLARTPQVVVWPTGPGMPAPSELGDGSLRTLWPSARLVAVDGDLVHEAGPRVAEAGELLAGALHPGRPARSTSNSTTTPPTAPGGPHP